MERPSIDLFEDEKKADNSTHTLIIIGIVISVIIMLLYFSEKFALPAPQRITGVWTGGAGLRQQSIDSSSNRGWNDLPELTRDRY